MSAIPYDWSTGQTGVDIADHSTRHENSGLDEISVTGLSGLLADDQHVLDSEVTAVAVALTTLHANTILKADSDHTPIELSIAEQTLVGRITSGVITALTAAQVRTLLNVEDGSNATPVSYSRTFHINAFHFPNPAAGWLPTVYGAYLGASLSAVKCWLPLNFLKVSDIITAYNLVGDATETLALTLDCKLVQVNKADPLTTTDITNGAIAQVTAGGNFDIVVNPDDTTVATDKQYVLELLGTTGVGDEIYVTGAEVVITRLI